jgi:hypothetical protein
VFLGIKFLGGRKPNRSQTRNVHLAPWEEGIVSGFRVCLNFRSTHRKITWGRRAINAASSFWNGPS